MASPQKENGFTGIANEILEVLAKTPLNGTQRRILDVVFRFTFGFNRKKHEISASYISEATRINKRQIQRELNELIQFQIVKVVEEATFKSSRVLAFNKDYESWQVTKKTPGDITDTSTGDELDTSTKSGKNNPNDSDTNGGKGIYGIPGGGSGLVTQEINIKDNIKEKSIDDFFNQIWALYPLKKGKNKVSNSSKKELYRIGYEELTRAIERYKKYVDTNSWMKYQHGSTFFSSGYVDYLDENYTEEEQTKTWGWDR